MRRFLVEQQPGTVEVPVQSKYLPQDLHIVSARKKAKHRDKQRSKTSYQSFTSYSSEEQVFIGFGADPTAYTGEWVIDDRFEHCRNGFGYSSTLSGDLDGE